MFTPVLTRHVVAIALSRMLVSCVSLLGLLVIFEDAQGAVSPGEFTIALSS